LLSAVTGIKVYKAAQLPAFLYHNLPLNESTANLSEIAIRQKQEHPAQQGPGMLQLQVLMSANMS
jgi:hypothetical protein